MQDQYFISTNGQEVQLADFNLVALEASHADDVVLAELLRMTPYGGGTLTRAILPYAFHGLDASQGTVSNGGGTITGSLAVNPFRAVIGSQAAGASQFTDIRSALFVNASQSNTDHTVSFSAQAGGIGTTRVDLVYATLMVDVPATAVTRYVKSPITATTTPPVATSISVTKKTYVTVSVASNGTTSATPTLSTLPSDPPGGFNIPLAYVVLPNGFGPASVIPATSIIEIAPVISPTVNADVAPLGQLNTAGSVFFAGSSKSNFYLPPSMNAKLERFGAFDATIANGTYIDRSTDWRRRFVKAKVQVTSGNALFSWISANAAAVPNGGTSIDFLGNSMSSAADPTLFTLTNANTGGVIPGGSSVSLQVSRSTGFLYLTSVGTPGASVFIWLEASSQFTNLV